jgi:signal transduction histidine kinase/ActR/RegA family two-component response regulator
VPQVSAPNGYRIEGGEVSLFHSVVENGEAVGTIYLRARYDLDQRIKRYLVILAGAMAFSLAVAMLVSWWLQAAVTRPILDVTAVAREVMQSRNYNLRARKTTNDEVGVLVDSFNRMLAEISARTRDLEESNRVLVRETRERREAEDALRLADQRKDEFLATLAHELRNPLAPLMSGLEIMQLTGPDSPASANARGIMERQLRHMVRLIDELIDVSRISTGKLTVRKERIDLLPVMRSALESTARLVEERHHILDAELPGSPIWLDGDATRLAQVFTNLLNNAAKYTEPGGRIAVRLRLDDARAVVDISDTGIGIPSDMLDRVFDMFTQVDTSLERPQAGLGVGLTLARRIVELHGGTLAAHSAGSGAGSTFTVTLPLGVHGQASAPQETAVPEGAATASTAKRHRILLVDDNVDFVSSLAGMLAIAGHDVRVAHDGATALAIVEDFVPDACFLDIGMPKMNGYELAARLRQHPSCHAAMLVAVTGWGQEKDRHRAAEAGFDDHLVKPVSFAAVEALLARSRASETAG